MLRPLMMSGAFCALAALVPLVGAQAGADTVLYKFQGKSDGGNPTGSLIADGAGNLYGTAVDGGKQSRKNCGGTKGTTTCGVVFRVSPKGAETAFYQFGGGSDGAIPESGLVGDPGGNHYGVTAGGGTSESYCKRGCGTVFKFATDETESVLHRFVGGNTDGQGPAGSLTLDKAGNLYGTAALGGSSTGCGLKDHGCGTAFKIASGGKESILHVFTGGSDGAYPVGGLVEDSSGNFYGTTGAGGGSSSCGSIAQGCGTVFKIAANGTESVLHGFSGGSDGAYPIGGLLVDTSGNLYGTTASGGNTDDCGEGPYGCGTVYKIAANGSESVLHAFTGGTDGGYPVGSLIEDGSGNLYGTTVTGGNSKNCGAGLPGCGTVFEISAGGSESLLHVFAGGRKDGAYPMGGLLIGKSGHFYGTTLGGGIATKGCFRNAGGGCGTVFEIN